MAEANDVSYGLTAGVFSGDQAEIDQFVEQIEAGVIYINRAAGATTGAWPGVQSFCGWKRSGSMGKGGLGPLVHPGLHARAEPHHREEPFVTSIRQSTVTRRPRRRRDGIS